MYLLPDACSDHPSTSHAGIAGSTAGASSVAAQPVAAAVSGAAPIDGMDAVANSPLMQRRRLAAAKKLAAGADSSAGAGPQLSLSTLPVLPAPLLLSPPSSTTLGAPEFPEGVVDQHAVVFPSGRSVTASADVLGTGRFGSVTPGSDPKYVEKKISLGAVDALCAQDDTRSTYDRIRGEVDALKQVMGRHASPEDEAAAPWGVAEYRGIALTFSGKVLTDDETEAFAQLQARSESRPVDSVLIAMKRAPGSPLGRGDRCSVLPEAMCHVVMQRMVAAVQYCHVRGVMHCDLKPQNLVFEEATKRVRLVDFGEAIVCQRIDGAETGVDGATPWETRLPIRTRSSAGYSAPECGAATLGPDGVLIAKPTIDYVLSDIFSVGATAFALLTGAPPPALLDFEVDADSRAEWYTHLTAQIDRLPVSAECKDFLKITLQPEPAARDTHAVRHLETHPWLTQLHPASAAAAAAPAVSVASTASSASTGFAPHIALLVEGVPLSTLSVSDP